MHAKVVIDAAVTRYYQVLCAWLLKVKRTTGYVKNGIKLCKRKIDWIGNQPFPAVVSSSIRYSLSTLCRIWYLLVLCQGEGF